MPTLLIAGKFDRAFAPLLPFARTIPHIEVRVLDGGHAVNIDAAGAFNAAVMNFISRF